MSEETPESEGQPSPASPEETPTAETKPFTYDDAVQQSAAEDAPPAASTAPPATEADVTQATPVAATAAPAPDPTPAPAPAHREGIFIPKWVGLVAAVVIAALVFGGIGYAIGDSSDSGSTQNASNTLPSNGNGNGTRQLPGGGQIPGGQIPGNGNGNGNGNGTGNGGTTSNAGFLGVGVQTSADGKGVEITEVASGSPAANAGLKQGDVVTAIDGSSVTSSNALRSAVLAKESGDEISVTYTRGGQSNTVKVTLASRSQAQSS
jgi:membrane-associated protease RseP (regulator of RpoE activity)